MLKDELAENWIDDLIQDCIDNLSDDDIKKGGDSLVELARAFAKAGMPINVFQDMRIYIIESAKKKTDATFIDEKLRIIERELMMNRTGTFIYTG